MCRKPRLKASPSKQTPTRREFTAAAVQLTPGVSSPVYAYGINLLPTESVAEEVMKLNAHLAQAVRETGVTYSLADHDQRFQALLR